MRSVYCVCTCIHARVCSECESHLGYALLSSNKFSLFSNVTFRNPASNGDRPQQWDCLGVADWQQCPDTEHDGIQADTNRKITPQQMQRVTGGVTSHSKASLACPPFHEACLPALLHTLLKHTARVANLMMDALWVGVSCENKS